MARATLNWAETLAMSSWDGITVAGAPPRVTHLVVPSKSLTGTIPAALGALTNLQNLDLGFNQLTGPIPTELGALTNLIVLRLTGNDTQRRHPRGVGRPHEPAQLMAPTECDSPAPSPWRWAPS